MPQRLQPRSLIFADSRRARTLRPGRSLGRRRAVEGEGQTGQGEINRTAGVQVTRFSKQILVSIHGHLNRLINRFGKKRPDLTALSHNPFCMSASMPIVARLMFAKTTRGRMAPARARAASMKPYARGMSDRPWI